MAVALLAAAQTPAAGRFAHSVWNLGRQLQPTASAQPISAIERIVLNLAAMS